MNNRQTLLIIPIVLFITTSVLVSLGILFEWFGETRSGIMKFCEYARSGYIKQPANSVSNLAFSLAGFYIAKYAYKNNASKINRMSATVYFPLLLSCSMIILGAGSFAMHATNTAAGGFIDLFGMFMFSSFVASYALTRWFSLSNLSFLLIYVAGVTIGSYFYLNPSSTTNWLLSSSELWFMMQLIVAFIIELLLRYVRKIEINAALGWASIFLLILAFTIWNLSHDRESILCDPHLWLQGHAIWHVLNAIGACFVFLFYTTEIDPSLNRQKTV